jgi:MFS family permease
MMGSTIGQTVGPPLGGLIVAHMGWLWIFYIKIPVAAATVIAGWDLLGAERRDRAAAARLAAQQPAVPREAGSLCHPAQRRRMDVWGTALLGALLAALFVPLIFSPLWGWTSARTIAPLASVVVLAVAFLYTESRASDPVLDLGLFRRSRVFAAANTASLLFMATSYGVTIFTAVYREAMLVGTGIAVIGAFVSLVRERSRPRQS